MKELKKAAITFRVQPQLKQRFQQALEREGITQSQFFVAKILEFCEESERRRRENEKM
jgi:antitoxin component of RelBE/YafQ-DinJ toxin-antitoxin module